METNLSNRELLILAYFEKHKVATSRELAEFLSVSDRTIKSDLKSIRNNLDNKHYEIKSVSGIGYEYHDYTQNIDAQFEDIYRDKDLIIHNYDRIAYIIQEFLVNDNYIKYEDLADKLFVGRSTLQKDMVKVKKLLSKFEIEFNQKPNYGVKIVGKERDIRSAISYFFYNSFWGVLGENKLPNKYKVDNEMNHHIITEIKKQLEDYQLNDNMIQNLAYQVSITLNRSNKEKHLESNLITIDEATYSAANNILNNSANYLNLNKIGRQSIHYIGNYILGFQLKEERSKGENTLTKELVDDIVREIYLNFDLDFSKDMELLKDLETHIEQIVRRIEYKTPLYNSQILNYFRDYLFATKITISAVNILENTLKEKISMDEYGDFILFFQTALELNPVKKVKIGLYTGNNIAEGKLTYHSIYSILNKNKFELTYIERLSSLNEFDIVLTSYPISDIQSNTKVIKGNFDKNNITNINKKIYNYNIEYNKESLLRYIHKDSIVIIDSDQKDEIKRIIIEYLEQNGYLKEGSVRKLIFHELGNRTVHIQDLYKIMKKELCLFVILEKPVIWDKTVIENLFLIKTKKDGDNELPYLCELFSNFVNNPIALNEVREEQEYKMLIRELIESSKL